MSSDRPAYLRVLYILALVSLTIHILVVGASLLKSITIAAFLAMLLTPLAGWLERRRIGRFAGAMIPVLGGLCLFILFVGLVIRQIGNIGGSLDGASDRVGDYLVRLNSFLSWHLNLDEAMIREPNPEAVEKFMKDSGGRMLSMMGGVTRSLLKALIVPAITFFFLFYRSHLYEFTIRFFQNKIREDVGKRVEEARLVAQNYFGGMMKVIGILAVLNSSVLLLIGVENAIFFGVFAALLDIVPFIGPLFGAILPILFLLVTRDGFYAPIGVAVAFILIQLVESYFLTPRIVGHNVRINPLVVFFGLLAGSMIWGVVGMIIIIPVLSISMQFCRLTPRTEPFAYLLGIPPKKEARRGRKGHVNV